MENKIIQFPQTKAQTNANDPVLERALFFADYEIAEICAVIPQADEQAPAKFVY